VSIGIHGALVEAPVFFLTVTKSFGKVAYMLNVAVVKALANERRLQILEWLKDPRAHFPAQVYGDLVRDGVCGLYIAEKLGITQATAGEHLRILVQAGLLCPKRIRQWTFFKRDENRIREVKRSLHAAL
jgi:ArsR family transcriptional regulator